MRINGEQTVNCGGMAAGFQLVRRLTADSRQPNAARKAPGPVQELSTRHKPTQQPSSHHARRIVGTAVEACAAAQHLQALVAKHITRGSPGVPLLKRPHQVNLRDASILK
jgi:hypothetical protein